MKTHLLEYALLQAEVVAALGYIGELVVESCWRQDFRGWLVGLGYFHLHPVHVRGDGLALRTVRSPRHDPAAANDNSAREANISGIIVPPSEQAKNGKQHIEQHKERGSK